MLLVGGLFLVLGQSMRDAAAAATAAAAVAARAVAGGVAGAVAARRWRLGDVIMMDVNVGGRRQRTREAAGGGFKN